jgi:hypothetical protein
MANVLEEFTTENQSSLLFLRAKVLNAKDIHKDIFPVYGGKCLLRKAVHNWVKKFSRGRSKFVDNAGPGRPVVSTEATVQWVEEFIRAVRRIMIDSVTTPLACFHELAYSIMDDRLKFRKV